ncbi:MAG TPA: CDP-alcohol phosphatidyltransferase family protein [Phenylobacterium sp.]|nr:CDP-alcohol phosphatidyltransferase family protein [Phenylobacterium sp.]
MTSNPVAIARILLLIPLIWLLTDGGVFHYWAALFVFLACGLGGLIEGYLPHRARKPSPVAGMLDAMADRLLTVVVVAGLIASGMRDGLVLVASLVLIARDVVLASINEALPTKLDISVSGLEKGRLAFQVLGFGFLIAPNFPLPEMFLPSHLLGGLALIIAGVLAVITLADYGRRASRALKVA